MEKILEIKNLVKEYKTVKAVDGVSFFVGAGEIVGLLGPNGAGKTTIINMILGVLDPTAGTIEVMGKDAESFRSEANQNTNFAAVYSGLPGNLTVWENLYIFGIIYGAVNVREKIKSLLKEYDLEKFEKSKAGALSSGEHSRLLLAKASLNDPQLLLLDEPTASIDPSTAQLIREKIRLCAKEKQTGILWTSHNMQEVEAVCDRVLFLSHGKILLEGDPKTLPAKYGKNNLEELFIMMAREPLALEI